MGMEEVTPFLILVTIFLTTFSNACISTQHTLLKYISLRSVVCIAYKINLNLLISHVSTQEFAALFLHLINSLKCSTNQIWI